MIISFGHACMVSWWFIVFSMSRAFHMFVLRSQQHEFNTSPSRSLEIAKESQSVCTIRRRWRDGQRRSETRKQWKTKATWRMLLLKYRSIRDRLTVCSGSLLAKRCSKSAVKPTVELNVSDSIHRGLRKAVIHRGVTAWGVFFFPFCFFFVWFHGRAFCLLFTNVVT